MKDKNSKLYKISVAIFSIAITSIICYLIVRAGDLNPTGAPGDTMKTLDDIYCKQTGCATSSFSTDSSATPTSTMHTLDEIYAQTPDFPRQKYANDDRYCTNNNGTANSACGVGDPEYTGEESNWSSSTDATPPSTTLSSGIVYKDSRTGLYWSDTSTTTMTNSFTMGCTDAQVNNGTCSPCNWATKGAAIGTCCGLDLDCAAIGCSSSTDWRVPTQKELIQAILDGSMNIIPQIVDVWSSTEYSGDSAWAHYMLLNYGQAYRQTKATLMNVICVRP